MIAGALYPGNESWPDLNTGLLVIAPNPARTQAMFDEIGRVHSADGSDQGFLQSYYSNWKNEPERRLPHRYSVPAIYLGDYCRLNPFTFSYRRRVLKTNVAVIHYWGRYKPWLFNSKTFSRKTDAKWEQSFLLWWDAFTEALSDKAKKGFNPKETK